MLIKPEKRILDTPIWMQHILARARIFIYFYYFDISIRNNNSIINSIICYAMNQEEKRYALHCMFMSGETLLGHCLDAAINYGMPHFAKSVCPRQRDTDMFSRELHGAVEVAMDPNSERLHGEVRMFALSDNDDNGHLVLINRTDGSHTELRTLVTGLGKVSERTLAISTRTSDIFITGLTGDKSTVHFLSERLYLQCHPCRPSKFALLGHFGQAVDTGIAYAPRMDGLIVFKKEIEKGSGKVRIYFARHPEWETRWKSFGRKHERFQQEVASLPDAFEGISTCVEDGRPGSLFVYCAGGGYQPAAKAFVIRVEIPLTLQKKPTNDWLVMIRLKTLGPLRDMVWALPPLPDGTLYAAVATNGGEILQIPTTNNDCPAPVNRSDTHKFRKFSAKSNLDPCAVAAPVCNHLGSNPLWGVRGVLQMEGYLFAVNSETVMLCGTNRENPYQAHTVQRAHFPTRLMKDSGGTLYYLEKDRNHSFMGMLSTIARPLLAQNGKNSTVQVPQHAVTPTITITATTTTTTTTTGLPTDGPLGTTTALASPATTTTAAAINTWASPATTTTAAATNTWASKPEGAAKTMPPLPAMQSNSRLRLTHNADSIPVGFSTWLTCIIVAALVLGVRAFGKFKSPRHALDKQR